MIDDLHRRRRYIPNARFIAVARVWIMALTTFSRSFVVRLDNSYQTNYTNILLVIITNVELYN